MATKKNETNAAEPKNIVLPMYTVEEFAKVPQSLGLENPDIIRAAFKTAKVKSATVDDAKAIVNKFKNKEVK